MLISPIEYVTEDYEKYKFNIDRKVYRGNLSIASIADLHFCIMNPKIQYDILHDQFIKKIKPIRFDILAVPGDIFNRKYMSDTEAIMYANKFIGDMVLYCRENNTTLVLIEGTKEHDAGQLSLFYHYLSDPEIDIRIVENIKFEYIKGAKILCIPELYGVPEDVYQKYLFYSGEYDLCFMHGTMKGAVYSDNVGQGRLFTIEDFSCCRGPIISGHIHTGGCFNSHFYYTGSPLRWKFGEENEKGFLILLYDLDSRRYYIHLEPIISYKYTTINLDQLISTDPKDMIDYINRVKEEQEIDFIRVELNKDIPSDNLEILKNYYKTNNEVKFKINEKERNNKKLYEHDQQLYQQYNYIFDNNLSEYEKLAKYINDSENSIFISADDIKSLLEDM